MNSKYIHLSPCLSEKKFNNSRFNNTKYPTRYPHNYDASVKK